MGEWEAADAAAPPAYFTSAGAAPVPAAAHQALRGAALDLFRAAAALDDAAALVRVAAGAPDPRPARRGRRGLRGLNPFANPASPAAGTGAAMSPRAAAFVASASDVDAAFSAARAALRRVAPGALGPAAKVPAGDPQASALDAARKDFARAAAELADAANEIHAAATPGAEPRARDCSAPAPKPVPMAAPKPAERPQAAAGTPAHAAPVSASSLPAGPQASSAPAVAAKTSTSVPTAPLPNEIDRSAARAVDTPAVRQALAAAAPVQGQPAKATAAPTTPATMAPTEPATPAPPAPATAAPAAEVPDKPAASQTDLLTLAPGTK